MCGFGFTNKQLDNDQFDSVTEFTRRRGPDKTTRHQENEYFFFHHLLSITGAFVEQPYIDQKSDIFCIYNGEIYNHEEFGSFQTDGQCLIPVYQEYGESFCRQLDGEFALVLVDFKKQRLIVSTDTFSTKPMWLAIEGSQIGVASYSSAVIRMGFQKAEKVPANTTRVFDLKDLQLLKTISVNDFDLRQFKESYDDWITAFENSIRKRTRGLREQVFIGLSSGYDSGAIACELSRQAVPFMAYTVKSAETPKVLNERFARHDQNECIKLTRSQYRASKHFLKNNAEDFVFGEYVVTEDWGAIGLSYVCQSARRDGYKILLSGQGADEIISDYGFGGTKYLRESGFGGLFPEDLSSIFPYTNFYEGAQVKWMFKEESVAGSHGIETRYPFLDKACVQEFLWLTHSLKNLCYKAPVGEYLKRNNYPFEEGVKMGFSANKKLVMNLLIPSDLFAFLKGKLNAIRREIRKLRHGAKN
jgi:asparagine synthase (glutamine-hydrolysing)